MNFMKVYEGAVDEWFKQLSDTELNKNVFVLHKLD